jgi:RNA polymerase-binding protein DksA
MVVKKSAEQPPAESGDAPAGTGSRRTAPAKTATAKKVAAKKAAPGKKAAAKKAAPAGKKAAAKKTAPGKKTAAKAATRGNAAATAAPSAGQAPAVGRKAAGKKAAAKKAAARKAAPAQKAAAGKRAAGRKTAGGKHVGRDGSKTGAGTVTVEKTAAGTAASGVPAARGAAEAGVLAVLPGEEPWTAEEAEEARTELVSEVERLKAEIASSEAAVAGMLRDSADSGGDEADTGAKNISRESELALAANTRDMLVQAEHALQRLDEGTYGLCEVCGNPIGKARMQAFPRATLCLDDKQRQERR